MTLTKAQLVALPKIELHLHLDGSVAPSTLIELAAEQGMALPTDSVSELLAYMSAPEDCESLNEYLRTFDFVLPYLQTYSALERTAYELVVSCAADGVNYVEVRFAPMLHTRQGLTVEEAYEAVIAGLQRAEQQNDIIARCIGICLRGHSEQENLAVVEKAARFLHRGLVAVDLAGAEALYPPELYVTVFQRAQQLGLPITIHAGEAGGANYIEVAVQRLGAKRIGHGVRLEQNEELLRNIAQQRIPLEFCPISNIQTKAIEHWEAYPLLRYLEAGIAVTVNTDNHTVSQTSLSKELMTLQKKLQLDRTSIVQLQENALEAIFLEEPVKQQFKVRFKGLLEAWKNGVDAVVRGDAKDALTVDGAD